MTRVEIDLTRCMGHGLCYSEVPDLIDDDDRGLAHVRGDGNIPSDRLDAVQRAKRLCPERAVVLSDSTDDPQR